MSTIGGVRTRPENPGAAPRPSVTTHAPSRWAAGCLVLLALIALCSGWLRGWTTPLEMIPDESGFSAHRAREAAAPLLTQPRVTGTPSAADARARLIAQLTDLGYHAEVRDGVGVFRSRNSAAPAGGGFVSNIVATRPGTDPHGTVVLATHYDTVPGSPGGGDDGVGVAVLLEAARALAHGPASRNDLVLLLTDGEEPGMIGAEAFMHDGADRLTRPVVVINHDARGNAGVPLVSRTSGDMGDVVNAAPRAELETFTETLFEQAPNDTDFSRFKDAGWLGVDIALVGGSAVYHAPTDTAATVDSGALQRMGSWTLGMARGILDRDLAELSPDQRYVYTSAPSGVISVFASAEFPLAVAGLVLALVAMVRRRRSGDLTVRDTVLSLLVLGILNTLAVVLGALLWPVSKALAPSIASATLGEPTIAAPFLWAEFVVALLMTVTAAWILRQRGLWAPATAGLIGLSTLMCVASATIPGLATPLLLPVLGATLVAAVVPRLPGRLQLALISASLIPAAYLLGTQVDGAFDLGASGGGFTTITALLCLSLFLPVVGSVLPADARRWRGLLFVGAAWLLVPVLAAVGLGVNLNAPGPRQERLGFEVDTGMGRWQSSASADWSQDLVAAAPIAASLPGPTVEKTASTDQPDGRHVRLHVTSARGGSSLRITLPQDAAVVRVELAGRVLCEGVPRQGQVRISGLPARGADIDLVFAPGSPPVPVTVADATHDLDVVPGFTGVPTGWVVVQPTVMVATRETI